MVGSDALEKFARALPATGPDGEGLQATERGAPSPSLQNLLCRVDGPRDLSAGCLGRKLVGSVQQAQAHQPGAPTREGPTNPRDSDGSPRLDPVTSTNRAPAHYISQLLDGCVTRAAAVRTHVSPPRPLARPKTGVNLVKMFFSACCKSSWIPMTSRACASEYARTKATVHGVVPGHGERLSASRSLSRIQSASTAAQLVSKRTTSKPSTRISPTNASPDWISG